MNIREKKEGNAFVRGEQGLGILEALLAVAITLLVMAGALGAFKSITDLSVAATHTSENNHDLMVALNLLKIDLQKVDSDGLFRAGYGGAVVNTNANAWSATRCFNETTKEVTNNCLGGTSGMTILPAGTVDGNYIRFDAVKPGTLNDMDSISVFYEDSYAKRISVTVQDIGGGVIQLSPNNADPAALAKNGDMFNAIRPYDFILINDDIVQLVTEASNPGEPPTRTLRLNDKGSGINANHGQLMGELGVGPGGFDASVKLMRRVTYFRETDPETGIIWLMRQVNAKPPSRLIPGVTDLSLDYYVVGPNLERNASGDTVNNAGDQRNIRMVNVSITITAEDPLPNGKIVSNTISTDIAVRISDGANVAMNGNNEQEDMVTVTYAPNGGVGGAAIQIARGSQHTVLTYPAAGITRDWWNPGRWQLNPGGSPWGGGYSPGDVFAPEEDVTLFATWFTQN